MKLAMIRMGDGEQHLAAVVDGLVVDLTEAAGGAPWAQSLQALIEHGAEGLAAARTLLERTGTAHARPVNGVPFAPPLPRPPKNVLCVGKNYPEHIREGVHAFGDPNERPKAPVIFTKPPTAICGAGDPIRHPANTQKLDYEGELAVIIGKGGRGIPAHRAGEHVFGYMLLNDVTARDLQRMGPQWFIGKGCDTFCPTGPWVVLADPAHPQPEVEIRVHVNGVERQRFNTRDMIFAIADIIAFVSTNITLEPGDIIATGTGPGCGFALDPPGFLRVGDIVVVEADGFGRLENRVVAAGEA